MKRLALAAFFHTRRLAIVGLILLAGLLMALRLLAPLADGMSTQLAEHVGSILGMRVEVDALTVRMEGWSPRLTFTRVKLADPNQGRTELSARELRLDLNLVASLSARRLRIDGLTLVGADIGLERTETGRIEVNGLQALGDGQDPGALAFFLREGHFALTDSRLVWTDRMVEVAPIPLQIERMIVRNHGKEHELSLDARVAGRAETNVKFLARLRGSPSDLRRWSGELYASAGSDADLMAPVRSYLPKNLGVAAMAGQVETWWRLEQGRPVGLISRFGADAVAVVRRDLQTAPESVQLTFHALHGLASWSSAGSEQQLQLTELRARELGAEPVALSIALGPSRLAIGAGSVAPRGARQLIGGMSGLELAGLRQLAFFAVPELADSVTDEVRNQPIAGRLQSVVFALNLPADGGTPTQWRVKGDLDGLSVTHSGSVPGLEGFNITFDAMSKQGFARIESNGGQLDLRPQLAAPTPLTSFSGALDWRIEPAGSLHLWAPHLQMQTPDLSAGLRAELCLHRSASPYLNLHLQLRDADIRQVGRYLPVRVLDPPLVDWLNRALRGGVLTVGDFVLRGRLEDFPFDDQQGIFLMDLLASDATVDFSAPRAGVKPRPRWPALEDLRAEIRIINRRLDITAFDGRFLNSTLTQGSASMPNLWRAKQIVVDIAGQGPFQDGRRVLLGTPLEAQLGRLARALDVDGQLGIGLTLDIPFRRVDPVGYQGELRWDGQASATLGLGERFPPLELKGIQGQLGFSSERGVEAQGIQARLGQQPLVIDARTQGSGTAQGETLVEVQAEQASLAPLVEQFASPWWKLIDGDSSWGLQIRLSNRDFADAGAPIGVTFTSDLKGMALALPEPLGKSANATRPFALQTQVRSGAPQDLSVALGELKARLGLSAGVDRPLGIDAVAIGWNSQPPALPSSGAIAIDGQFTQLHLTPWLDWWKAHRTTLAQPGGASFALHPSRLRVKHLSIGGLELRGVDAQLAADQSGVEVSFSASDQSGSISLPPSASNQPVRVSLARWRLEKSESLTPSPGKAAKTRQRIPPDLGDLGPVLIDIDRLELGEMLLGQFAVRLTPHADRVDFRDLRLKGPVLSMQGQGDWQYGSGSAQTALNATIATPNAGQLLNGLGLYKGLQGSDARINAVLTWPGGPAGFSLDGAKGAVTFDFSAGRLLDVEPGVGRMLGILNVAALQRRLSLDFSDVVDQGFSFDQATGQISLADGLARIERFELLSSTADIGITGATNLVSETFDQTLTVTPKVGAGVALASAVVGGPLVGAAVFLADKVAGNAVDQLTRHQYQVTGSWQDPKFELLGASLGVRSSQPVDSVVNQTNAAYSTAKQKPAQEQPATRPRNLFLDHF